MDWIEALILGLVQGLTEFLPVSSSGHLELGKAMMGVEAEKSLTFSIVVHGATVLSTMLVFRKDIQMLLAGLFKFKWNEETQYITKIGISMVPVLVVGLFFKDTVESFFDGNIVFVGCMLIVTAALLSFSHFAKKREKDISFGRGFIIGIAQALAVLPGISRSGFTIATGLLTGVKKELVAKFSFLMVLLPIIGANILDLKDAASSTEPSSIGILPLVVGFIAAFISGWVACKWMVNIVKRGKLIHFAIYCVLVGVTAIIVGLL